MAEYIEREAVEKMLEGAQLISDADGEYCGYCTEDISIHNIPAADVVQVVHGRWDHTNSLCDPFCEVWCCSCCSAEDENGSCYNFCPNCGAKMDLDQERTMGFIDRLCKEVVAREMDQRERQIAEMWNFIYKSCHEYL